MGKKRNIGKKRQPWFNNMIPDTLDIGLWETLCRNCGKCCQIYNLKTGEVIGDCKYLVRDKYGKTRCKIYFDKKRMGLHLGHGNYCNFIRQAIHISEDCGYKGILRVLKEIEEKQKNESGRDN